MVRLCLGIFLLLPQFAWAAELYQEPAEFVAEVFEGETPAPRVVWLTAERQAAAREILGHAPPALRIRYWAKEARSAWILEEIGKEQPITTGVVIEAGKIRLIRVLVFRESRGWEVRYPFFTDQFRGAGLKDNRQLDRYIDGISGATLSVLALQKQARLALYLYQEVFAHAQ